MPGKAQSPLTHVKTQLPNQTFAEKRPLENVVASHHK